LLYDTPFITDPIEVIYVDQKARNDSQCYLSQLVTDASRIDWMSQQTDTQWDLVRVIRDAYLILSPEIARDRLPVLYQLLKSSPDTEKFQEWAKGCPEQYQTPPTA